MLFGWFGVPARLGPLAGFPEKMAPFVFLLRCDLSGFGIVWWLDGGLGDYTAYERRVVCWKPLLLVERPAQARGPTTL